MAEKYGPDLVASSFIKQYYEMLSFHPNQLYKFYAEDSLFMHCDGSKSTVGESVNGLENIKNRIEDLNLAGTHVDLSEGSVDAQRSYNRGVIVVVNGYVTFPNSSESKQFVQTFYLACQQDTINRPNPSYYVNNSIFRILSSFSSDKDGAVGGKSVHYGGSEVSNNLQTTASLTRNEVDNHQNSSYYSEQRKHEEAEDAKIPLSTATNAYLEGLHNLEKEGGDNADHSKSYEKEMDTLNNHSEIVAESVVDAAIRSDSSELFQSEMRSISPESHSVAAIATPSAPKSYLDIVKKLSGGVSTESSAAAVSSATPGIIAPPSRHLDSYRANKPPAPKPAESTASSAPTNPAKKVSSSNCGVVRAGYPVCIKQVPEETTIEDLREIFEPFGKILNIDIPSGKAVAYVRFDTFQCVKTVQDQPTPFEVHGVTLKIEERVGGGKGHSDRNNNEEKRHQNGTKRFDDKDGKEHRNNRNKESGGPREPRTGGRGNGANTSSTSKPTEGENGVVKQSSGAPAASSSAPLNAKKY